MYFDGKDVLIEDVSATAAFISNRFLEDSDLPKEFNRCADIRDYLLRTALKHRYK